MFADMKVRRPQLMKVNYGNKLCLACGTERCTSVCCGCFIHCRLLHKPKSKKSLSMNQLSCFTMWRKCDDGIFGKSLKYTYVTQIMFYSYNTDNWRNIAVKKSWIIESHLNQEQENSGFVISPS